MRALVISAVSVMALISACASTPAPKYNFADLRAAEIDNEFPADTEELKSRMAKVGTRLFYYSADLCPDALTLSSRTHSSYELCASEVELVISPIYNAYFKPGESGGTLTVSTALTRRLDNEELAFIVAHELAHHIGAHKSDPRTRHDLELEADYIAIFLIARAGFDTQVAPGVLRQIVRGQEQSTDTHPSLTERLNEIARAQEDVAQLHARGAALNPL